MSKSPRIVSLALLLGALILQVGCNATARRDDAPLPAQGEHEVTVIIALSAVVPAGVVGHAGIAVGEQFYDFGPDRVDRFQRIQGFGSAAGPWWDDPQQRGHIDYSLEEVISQLDEHVYPEGSLIAVATIPVTAEQAEQIAAYWEAVYLQMDSGQRVYNLLGAQCANVIAASMTCPPEKIGAEHAPPVPTRMRGMSPTRLYRWLHRQDRLSNRGRSDMQVQINLYQQRGGQIEPYTPRLGWSRLGMTPPVRVRLGIERLHNATHMALNPLQNAR